MKKDGKISNNLYKVFLDILYNEAIKRNEKHPFDVAFDVTVRYSYDKSIGRLDQQIINDVDYALFERWHGYPLITYRIIKELNREGYLTGIDYINDTLCFTLTEKALTIINSEACEVESKRR